MGVEGDLGRRIAERRNALGLSRDEVAARSGMDPTYLGSVETRASPVLSTATLRRLATALDTSVEALLGGGMERAPGARGLPVGSPAFQSLDPEQCQMLIAGGGVGRVVFVADRGPVALPVNFRVIGADIVFRTRTGSTIARALPATAVSFEVDQVDGPLCEGWSVLISGDATVIEDPSELADLQRLSIEPWAGPGRDMYVRVHPAVVTGRQIRHEPAEVAASPEAATLPPGYPEDLERDVVTLHGERLHLRPIRPDDVSRLDTFHRGLSPQSVYLRFFTYHPVLSPAELHRFTDVDYLNRLALVALLDGQIVAVGRFDRLVGTADAEVAFIVGDDFQHRGLGTLLLDELARAAWARGITAFVAYTLAENSGMLEVFYGAGFPLTTTLESGVVRVWFPIEPTPAYREQLAVREASRQASGGRTGGAPDGRRARPAGAATTEAVAPGPGQGTSPAPVGGRHGGAAPRSDAC